MQSTELDLARGTPLADAKLEETARLYVSNRYHLSRTAEALGVSIDTVWQRTRRPEVSRRIRELGDGLLRSADINAQRVMMELGRIAFADHRNLYDEDGELRNPRDMDDDSAAAISGVTYEARNEPGPRVLDLATGKMRPSRRTVQVVKIRKHDKVAALSLLARHFKLVGEDSDGVNALANVLADRLKAARQRVHSPAAGEGATPLGGGTGGQADTGILENDAEGRPLVTGNADGRSTDNGDDLA